MYPEQSLYLAVQLASAASAFEFELQKKYIKCMYLDDKSMTFSWWTVQLWVMILLLLIECADLLIKCQKKNTICFSNSQIQTFKI